MKKKLLLLSLFMQSCYVFSEEPVSKSITSITQIQNPNVPTPTGPYSQALYIDHLRQMLFITGQLPVNLDTGLLETDPAIATAQCMDYIGSHLAFCGLDFSNVVKVVIGLTNLDDWEVVAPIYASYFTPPYPTITVFQVQAFLGGAVLGIEMVAAV